MEIILNNKKKALTPPTVGLCQGGPSFKGLDEGRKRHFGIGLLCPHTPVATGGKGYGASEAERGSVVGHEGR